MKQKLLNKLWLRVGMIVAIMTTALSGTAWAETVTLVSGSGTSNYAVPTGWTTSGTIEGGSYLKFDNGTITSPEIAPHTGLSFAYTVATFGSGTNHPLTIRILNASTNAVIVEKTTATPTSSSYINTNSPLSLGDVNVAFKIQLYAPTGKGVRLRNYSITGTPVGGSSAVATETTIDDSGITNTDVNEGTAAGSLSASITAGGNAVVGATVTWSSSDTDVATIASDGTVTLVSAGSVTFTASYAGVSGEYQASSATYEMTVTDSTPIPTYTVTLGDDSSTLTEVSGGAGVTLPSRDNVGRYTFAGWSTTNVTSETTTAPTIIIPAGAYNPTKNVTLYPVYTKAEGSAAPSPFEVGNTGDFVIVFDRIDGSGKYFALPTSPTVSGGKITPEYVTVSDAEGVKYVTPENADGFTWTIAAATHGYTLFDGDNYIYHSNGGSSGTDLAYGSSTNYTWWFTKDGNYVKMAGMNGSTVNSRGMLFSGSNTTIGGYALSNWGNSDYYKTMILPVCSSSTTYYYSTPVAKTEPQILPAADEYHNCDLTGGGYELNLSGVSPNFDGLELHSEIVTASTTIDPSNYTWENQVLTVSGLAEGQGGTVVIRFWVEENAEYYGVEKKVTAYFRPQPVIPYGETIDTHVGTPVTISGIQGGDITLESSDINVATVDGLTITPVAEGTTTITITTAAVDDNWQAGTATFTLNVTAPQTWTLASSITSGKHYIIVNKESSKAMGAQNTNNRAAADVIINDNNNTVTVSSADVQEFVIYGPDASGNYTIYDADAEGYLYAAGSDKNYLKTETELDENNNGVWAISFNATDGSASVVAQGTNTRNEMRFNPNTSNNNPLFACYASTSTTGSPVYLYEKDGEATPTESVIVTDAGYATYCSENALDFTDTGITAYYGTAEGTKLTFKPITRVPANTGVLLVCAGGKGKTVNVPALSGAAADVTDNILKGVTTATTIDAEDYILNVKEIDGEKKAGFFKAGDKHKNLAANRAYIPASVVDAGVKSFALDLEDNADGIEETLSDSLLKSENIYNLAGQRLSKMQKGINIVNGKKVLK